ncbi:PP2C family protein-serine/threonine phosphatase [Streptomyces sp. NBC_01012]|uniref:PP2C family protein-serine/threonine phosphatase n=1 Tax=Streptomyces sp. NBC_01012 TaxID=2903717 RepID=UPI003863B31B|nr:serine/threonine-protein phosphatase [Streptomyces sp. NBC_01012]
MGKRDERRGGTVGNSRSRRFVRVLPVLMICAGVIFDFATPTEVTAVPLFAAAPLIAAPFFSPGGTARIGMAATLVVLVIRISSGALGEVVPLTDLFTLVTVSVLSLLINRVVRRMNEQLASARVIAETAMRAVLPRPEDRVGGLLVAARYEAAQADEFVGGDLYAVADTPFGVRLVLGDVRGKGLDAVGAVAVVIGAFREAAERDLSLEAVVQRLERALEREGSRRGGFDTVEGFVTAVIAEIPSGSQTLRVINRGHPEPLVLHGDGALDVLTPSAPALPLGMGLGTWTDRADEWTLPAGSMFLAFTDGLSEARNTKGVFYDPAARLRGRLFPGPDELLSALTDDVRLHTGGRSTDDLALLAVGRPAHGQQERRTTVKIVGRDGG